MGTIALAQWRSLFFLEGEKKGKGKRKRKMFP